MSEAVVLVTGATGYIASHVVKLLLERGYKVRGTVRSLNNQAKIEPLQNLVPDARHPLELVEACLTKDEGWDNALEGCTYVIHMASPFPNVSAVAVKEKDVIGPAKEGTIRVLKASSAAKVKRVVLTSSVASVFGAPVPEAGKTYTEEDWTDANDSQVDPYSKSKVLAEKAAWDYLKDLSDDEKFELAVINPSFVLGPVLMEAHKDATSAQSIINIMNKVYPAHPKLSLTICDVRDVAEAHVKAMAHPDAAGHRHIIYNDSYWYRDLALMLSEEFSPQGYSIPTAQIPYFVCWFASCFNKQVKNFVLPRFGQQVKCSNDRMVKVLGIEPTPVEKSTIDMAYSLIDLGIVRKARYYKQVGSRAEPKETKAQDDVKEAKEQDDVKEAKADDDVKQVNQEEEKSPPTDVN